MAYKVFTNGSVLNASEINDNLMNQSVMVFSNSTARAAALTAPVEGMLTWLQDTNKYENYNGTAWVALGSSAVLQVKSTFKSNTFTMSSNTFADVTDLSVSITPSSASSKVLAFFSLSGQADAATNGLFVRLMRDSTAIGIGDTDGSRIRTTYGNISTSTNVGYMGGFTFLDSPATTSAVTYKVQVASNTNGQTVFVNRLINNTDSASFARSASSITVMEVAA